MKADYSIRTVSQLTGLSDHLIRAWERRYDAIKPARTGGRHRKYSETDVDRLRLLARAVASGRSISRVAGLSDQELTALIASDQSTGSTPAEQAELLELAMRAVEALDPAALEDALVRSTITLGETGTIEEVIVPLMDRIGQAWHEGRLRIMHEHMASAVVRTLLGSALRAYDSSQEDSGVVVAGPTGQTHELGALACAVTAASVGFRVTYLGSGVPAAEMVSAVERTRSSALILSVVFPRSLTRLREEYKTLRRHLAEGVHLILGGASASQLDPGDSGTVRTLTQLRDKLAEILKSR